MSVMEYELLWDFHLADAKEVSARAPVIHADRLFQLFHFRKGRGFASTLVALDMAMGREIWRRNFDHVANTPVIAPDGRLVVSLFSGSMHAVSPAGDDLWLADCGDGNTGAPCLTGNRILVAGSIGRVGHTFCLDAGTGELLWRSHNGGHAYPIAATADFAIHATVRKGRSFGEATIALTAWSVVDGNEVWSAGSQEYLFRPLIQNGSVLIGARGSLRAYDLRDGRLRSALDLPQPAAANAGPVPVADGLVVADDSGTIRCARLRTGRRLLQPTPEWEAAWAWSIPDEVIGEPLAIGPFVGVLAKRGTFLLLDASTGQPVGPLLAVEHGRDGAGGIAAADDRLAIAFGRKVEAYRMSG